MTNADAELKRGIDAELASDPEVDAAQIGVSVDEGDVSLFGTVETYAERCAAEAATRRVGGVRSVAQHLTIKVQSDTTNVNVEAALVEAALEETQVVDQNEMMN